MIINHGSAVLTECVMKVKKLLVTKKNHRDSSVGRLTKSGETWLKKFPRVEYFNSANIYIVRRSVALLALIKCNIFCTMCSVPDTEQLLPDEAQQVYDSPVRWLEGAVSSPYCQLKSSWTQDHSHHRFVWVGNVRTTYSSKSRIFFGRTMATLMTLS